MSSCGSSLKTFRNLLLTSMNETKTGKAAGLRKHLFSEIETDGFESTTLAGIAIDRRMSSQG